MKTILTVLQFNTPAGGSRERLVLFEGAPTEQEIKSAQPPGCELENIYYLAQEGGAPLHRLPLNRPLAAAS